MRFIVLDALRQGCVLAAVLSLCAACGDNSAGNSAGMMAPPSLWQERASWAPSSPEAGAQFGLAVSISNDIALIGVPWATVGNLTHAGAVDVFMKSGDVWTIQQRLTATAPGAEDGFGATVAISGTTAVIGAYLADRAGGIDTGAAYIFERSGAGWSMQQELASLDGTSYDFFGTAVAIENGRVLIGARGADVMGQTDAGAAYVFERSGSVWSQQQKLIASDGKSADQFAVSLALSGNAALIGAHEVGTTALPAAGAAYVFEYTGSLWSQTVKLTPASGKSREHFGISLALSGDTALIGTYPTDTSGIPIAGGAYIFQRTGLLWAEQPRLSSPDGGITDRFGSAVALRGDVALVGAPMAGPTTSVATGAAYLFEHDSHSWAFRQKLACSDCRPGDQFGASVALSSEAVLVGAFMADTDAQQEAGSAYLFLPQ